MRMYTSIGMFVAIIMTPDVAISQSFSKKTLPIVSMGNLFNSPLADYDIGTPLIFNLKGAPTVKAAVRKGMQIRIFSISDGAALPGNWNLSNPDDCLVFLSLVFRFSQSQLNNIATYGKVDLGMLNRSAGWLSGYNSTSPGRYLLVIELSTQGDPPTLDDQGGSTGKYELIRVTRATKDAYFRQGFAFTVTPDNRGGGSPSPLFMQNQTALIAAAKKRSADLRCAIAVPSIVLNVEESKKLLLADNCTPAPGSGLRGTAVEVQTG